MELTSTHHYVHLISICICIYIWDIPLFLLRFSKEYWILFSSVIFPIWLRIFYQLTQLIIIFGKDKDIWG